MNLRNLLRYLSEIDAEVSGFLKLSVIKHDHTDDINVYINGLPNI